MVLVDPPPVQALNETAKSLPDGGLTLDDNWETSEDLRSLAAILSSQGQALPAAVDWNRLFGLGHRYSFLPLLYWRLQQQADVIQSVPAEIREDLQTRYHMAISHSFAREQESIRIIETLEQSDVSVLVLKGGALAYTVYPRPALRWMCDLDLLVDRTDLEHAGKVLESLGYQHCPEPMEAINPFNTEFTGQTNYVMARREKLEAVDLHWQLFSNEIFERTIALDTQGLWARAVTFQLGPTEAFSLSTEDTLAHVCLHLSLHGFGHLRGYVDIMQLIEVGGVDWNAFIDRVCSSRIRTACYFPLWRAATTWHVPVPTEVLHALQPGPLRRRLASWITRSEAVIERGEGHAWEHMVWLLVVDRLSDLILSLVWLVFPGSAWLKERYRLHSAWQAWVWTLVHPLIVLWQGLCSLRSVCTSR